MLETKKQYLPYTKLINRSIEGQHVQWKYDCEVHNKMNISVQKLLAKIEEELKRAKLNDNEKSLREKVYSIKIMCELILDEKDQENTSVAIKSPVAVQQSHATSFSLMNQPKKLNDDDANGDSLLDF
jgi:hypothetical protein